jgi:hypothetical protein
MTVNERKKTDLEKYLQRHETGVYMVNSGLGSAVRKRTFKGDYAIEAISEGESVDHRLSDETIEAIKARHPSITILEYE